MNKFKLCKVCSIPTGSESRTTFYDDVKVALGSWDGNEDDHDIFFYMDGEPLEVGLVIAEDFIVLEIQESDVKASNPAPEEYEDPNDYVRMGWVDSRGRP